VNLATRGTAVVQRKDSVASDLSLDIFDDPEEEKAQDENQDENQEEIKKELKELKSENETMAKSLEGK
jgi:hypothetical protein